MNDLLLKARTGNITTKLNYRNVILAPNKGLAKEMRVVTARSSVCFKLPSMSHYACPEKYS